MTRRLRSLAPTRTWLQPVLYFAVLLVILAAASAGAIETQTVPSFGQGLWWATSLITTVGFVGHPPVTAAGRLLSAFLMVFGFFLLAMISAALAALFVREEEGPVEDLELARSVELRDSLREVEQRVAAMEAMLAQALADPPSDRR